MDLCSIQLLLSVTSPLSGMSSSSSSIEPQLKEYTKNATAELEIESINTGSYLPDGKLTNVREYFIVFAGVLYKIGTWFLQCFNMTQ